MNNIIQVTVSQGEYDADFFIPSETWLEMLTNQDIFNEKQLEHLRYIYNQAGHKGTCYDLEKKYHLVPRSLNPTIRGVATRICKYLNIKFKGVEVENTYWIVMMKGRYIKNKNGRHFEWELRPELVKALQLIDMANEDDTLESKVELELNVGMAEGKKVVYYTTKYERNFNNRLAAIKIHGTVCEVCNFDFEKFYGELGKDYIEVHHKVPLSQINEEIVVNPETDLVCLCANCHRMIHRKKNAILTIEELKERYQSCKKMKK